MSLRLLNLRILPALAIFALAAVPGFTQAVSRQDQQQNQGLQNPAAPSSGMQNQDQQASGDQGAARELQGKILRRKEVGVEGSNTKSVIVLVELPNDQRIAVDMGPVGSLQGANLKEGDNVVIHGEMVMVGNDAVFVANQLDLNGKTFQVHRPLTEQLSDSGQQQSQQQQQRPVELSGTIENEQTVDVRGGHEKNKVVLLKTDKGRHIMVDLGPVDQLQAVRANKGDTITVTGFSGHVGERSILFAESVRSGNQNITINRPDFGPGQPGTESRQSQQPQQSGQR